jgi:hypothetical protein
VVVVTQKRLTDPPKPGAQIITAAAASLFGVCSDGTGGFFKPFIPSLAVIALPQMEKISGWNSHRTRR